MLNPHRRIATEGHAPNILSQALLRFLLCGLHVCRDEHWFSGDRRGSNRRYD
jgi:hypothetical protein